MSRETPEGKLKKEFRAWMKEQGAYRFSPVPTGYGSSGVDDFFCLRGLFIAAEAKAPGKYKNPYDGCTQRQMECLKEVRNARGIAFAYDDLRKAKDIITYAMSILLQREQGFRNEERRLSDSKATPLPEPFM